MTPNDDHYIGYSITDVARLMRTVFERRVRGLGLTRAQWLVIARVRHHPGLSQSEVADLLEIEKATAGRLIDRMERKGWIERRAEPRDRRVNRLHLTTKGVRLHTEIWPLAEATVDDALDSLTQAERRQLTALMSRVKATLLELSEDDPARAHPRARRPQREEADAL